MRLLLVINTNLLPILHRFRDIAFDFGPIKCYIWLYLVTPLVFNSPDGGVPWDDLRKIFCDVSGTNAVEILPKISTG